MIPYVIAGGAAVVGVKHVHDRLTTSTHDWILRKTFKKVDRATTDSAALYVDHVNDDVDADGHCAGVLDVNRVPDLIVSDFQGQSLVVEVEDAAALEQRPDEAAAQLSAFATPGYKRVLVTDDPILGEQFLKNRGFGNVAVTSHGGVTDLL